MGVLLLVGRGRESPNVIQELLDVEKCPRKPQYNLAHYLPLNLFYCNFENIAWYTDKSEIKKLIEELQQQWTHSAIK